LPEYAEQANKLGASIKDLYAANTLYYQQGLNSQQAMSVGVETMKMARIANMDAAKATEAMTAALRGFNMEINETSAGRINDVYSELAAITASDTEQIATAMSKTASIAASANMEFETTAALLAQIIETTQEAPETAGTAMKTIIARFTEVKELFSEGMISGEDSEGEEININKIDTALKTVGISLKDFLNGSKGIDDIFLELASKWNTLDLATQRYIATTAAGSRQQSRFIAMMSNYDRTMELVTAANNSAGASQKQFDKTLESLDAKL
jgi:TP901 family phage tail tape measure protein